MNDILYQNTAKGKKVVIPDYFAKKLVNELHHIYAHIAHKKIFKMMDEDFSFSNMRRNIHSWIRSCDICQKVKYRNNIGTTPLQTIKVDKPNQLLNIDFIGPLPTARAGMKYVLVCLDAFSKFVALYATENVINKIFNDHIPKNGTPER